RPAVSFCVCLFFFFSSRRRHTRFSRDWSSDVCSSDLTVPLTHELLHTIPLFRDRILLVASPGTPWAGRSVVKPQELAQMPMIAYQRESKFRAYVDASFQAAGITPDVIMEFDSHEAVKAMVAAGFGVAMMPSSAVADDIEEGALVELKIAGFEELARITSLIIRRDRHQSPPVRAFLDLVRRTCPLARAL